MGTYVAGLCDSIIICSASRIWPTSLSSSGLHTFMWAFLLHLSLSVGYGVSIWANFHLIRLRSVRLVHDSGASSQVTSRPTEPSGEQSVPAASRQAVEAGQQQLEPAPAASPQQEADCAVCMEEPCDTVL